MTSNPRTAAKRRPDAQCPVRPGDPCTLCQLDVTGPQDCPLVYLVMRDPEFTSARAEPPRSSPHIEAGRAAYQNVT